jgi:hypothetical protein
MLGLGPLQEHLESCVADLYLDERAIVNLRRARGAGFLASGLFSKRAF